MISTSDSSVFDNLLEGFQIIDAEFRYRYVNRVVAAQAKKTREELVGFTMMEVFPGIETTPMFARLKECLATRTATEIENHFEYPDGSSAWFLLKMEPIEDCVLIMSIDISTAKAAEQELSKQIKRLEALREIDIAIVSTTNISLALKTVLDKVSHTLAVDAADVLLLNSFSNTLEFAAGRGFRTRGIERTHLLLGQGHAGRAAAEQKPQFVGSLSKKSEEFLRWDLIAGEDFVSFAAVPLISRGNTLGVLEVFHRTALSPDQTWFEFFEALGGQTSIAIDSGRLFHDLRHTNMDLTLAYETTIEGWSKALDLRDKETEGHTLRVTDMTVKMARLAGFSERELVNIRRGALLHDIGKMGVPDSILLKPAPLSPDEWQIMRKHPTFAKELLHPIEYLRPSLSIPFSHHERFDGTGYPQGLKGEQIPLAARLFAAVDVWDALRFDRPYRKAWPENEVLAYLQQGVGTHFDPYAVEVFMAAHEQSPESAGLRS